MLYLCSSVLYLYLSEVLVQVRYLTFLFYPEKAVVWNNDEFASKAWGQEWHGWWCNNYIASIWIICYFVSLSAYTLKDRLMFLFRLCLGYSCWCMFLIWILILVIPQCRLNLWTMLNMNNFLKGSKYVLRGMLISFHYVYLSVLSFDA